MNQKEKDAQLEEIGTNIAVDLLEEVQRLLTERIKDDPHSELLQMVVYNHMAITLGAVHICIAKKAFPNADFDAAIEDYLGRFATKMVNLSNNLTIFKLGKEH